MQRIERDQPPERSRHHSIRLAVGVAEYWRSPTNLFTGAVGVGGSQPVQLGTAGLLPTQLFGVLAVIGELVVVIVPP
jgi:hypothetical protein